MQSDVVLVVLMAVITECNRALNWQKLKVRRLNWQNWKLEDWNEKR